MSDSENDYESADEDTEESSTAEKAVEPVKSELTKKTEDTKSQAMEETKSSDLSCQKSNVSSETKDSEKKEREDDKSLSESTDKVQDDKEVPTKSTAGPSKAGQVIDTQPKRVTLRLEKKLQQKNRTASAESERSEDSKPSEKLPSSSSWGFSSWGTSLLSTAAASVSTFTNQVSQGIGTVLESVESSLGAPAPEELAAVLRERKEQEEIENEQLLKQQTSFEDDSGSVEDEGCEEEEEEDDEDGEDNKGLASFTAASSLLTGVTSITKAIESTGTKVISGGLDALELIGKKTFDMLTEGDPGFRKKRSAFSRGAYLSQILREAKEKAEAEQANMPDEDSEDAVHFSRFFDEYKGLVHLEALEMLSSQYQQKVQGVLLVSGESEEKEVLEQISRICEDIPSAIETPDGEMQDFDAAAGVHIKQLQIPFNLGKINKVRSSVISYLSSPNLQNESEEKAKDIKDIYRQSISSLAEFTACCVEQFHKFGELILVQGESDFDILMCATHLTGLTSVLCTEISNIATRFCQYLNTVAGETDDDDSISAFITTTYLEASNSTTYVQDAFQLLVPVLQSALIK